MSHTANSSILLLKNDVDGLKLECGPRSVGDFDSRCGSDIHLLQEKHSFLNPRAPCFFPETKNRNTLGQGVLNHSATPFVFRSSLVSVDDDMPEVIEVDTPNTSFEVGVGDLTSNDLIYGSGSTISSTININTILTFVFCNTYEFSAYYFAYVLAMYVVLALVIGPNVPHTDDLSDGDDVSPHELLQSLRLKNVDRIIIGHLNINSIRNKIGALGDLIGDRIDIFLISETKIDQSFPPAQFHINGFSDPYRLDRNEHGGGLLLYIRSDITTKPLPLISGGIECIIMEATISKKKWLLFGVYNPQKAGTSSFLEALGRDMDHYLPLYDNVILLGDFNSEVSEGPVDDFCSLYNLKNLIKSPTCFKSNANPSCIDLILTNRINSFQNSSTVETGLSDFHHLVFTVLKTTFRKKTPKMVRYRDYRNYSSFNYLNDVNRSLAGVDLHQISHDDYDNLLMGVLDRHAPLKSKCVRGNDQPFMTAELRKEHMKRTMLLNKYRSDLSAYKKQRNLCVGLLRKVKA